MSIKTSANIDKVVEDCQQTTAVYGGLAIVYKQGDLYGWAYTAGPADSVAVAGFVDGKEWAIIGRVDGLGRGCGSAQFLGPAIEKPAVISDKVAYSLYSQKWYTIR